MPMSTVDTRQIRKVPRDQPAQEERLLKWGRRISTGNKSKDGMLETSLKLSQDPLGRLLQPTTGPQAPGAISEAPSFESLLSDLTAQMQGIPLDRTSAVTIPFAIGAAEKTATSGQGPAPVITPPSVETEEALKAVKAATISFTVASSGSNAETPEPSEHQQKPEAPAPIVFVPPYLQMTMPVRNKESGISGVTSSPSGKRPGDIQEWLQMRNVASSITIPIPAQPLRAPSSDYSPDPALDDGEIAPEPAIPTPVLKSEGQPEIDLEKFEVRKLQFTVEPAAEPEAARQLLKIGGAADSLLPGKGDAKPLKQKAAEDSPAIVGADGELSETNHEQPIAKAEAPQPVRTPVEPPAPPPVARQVSMDVGDADSQVHVVIRERNGDLEVRFDTANERLRRDLEGASPMLVHDLERGAVRVADLDFSSFGSATESDRQDQQQQRPKKNLKSEAVFAELDETTYSETRHGFPEILMNCGTCVWARFLRRHRRR